MKESDIVVFNLKLAFQLLIVGILIILSKQESCKSNIHCIDSNGYKLCVNIDGNATLVGHKIFCPENTTCDDEYFTCVEEPATTSSKFETTKTTISDPITSTLHVTKAIVPIVPGISLYTTITSPPSYILPPCDRQWKRPAPNCDQFYECKNDWFFWWKLVLQSCPEGQIFNNDTGNCEPAGANPCANTIIATVPPTEDDKPTLSQLCKPSGYQCLDFYTYQTCVNVNGVANVVGNVQTCPEGNICNDEGFFPCEAGVISTTTAPGYNCQSAGSFPAPECNKYYQCQSDWFIYFKATLVTCPTGRFFNETTGECESSPGKNCATATSAPVVAPAPQCSGSGNLTGPTCFEYYQCVNDWVFWWNPVLQQCPTGYAFNGTACALDSRVECAITLPPITTVPPTTVLPQCSGGANLTGPSCFEYYQCVNDWFFWWNPVLQQCPIGYAFNGITCAPSQQVPCATTIAPTTTTTTTTTTIPPPTTVPILPQCTGSGNLTGPTCFEYYQCVNDWVFWWNAVLEQCPIGQAFNGTLCLPLQQVPCASTIAPTTTTTTTTTTETPTTYAPPTCTQAGKYPSSSCGFYYECVQDWIFWWKSQLEQCPEGQAFDQTSSSCVQSSACA